MLQKPVFNFFVILFATLAAGCGEDSKNCTLIGCEDGINLVFEDADGKPVGVFSGDVTVGDKVISIDCGPNASDGGGYSCYQNRLFLRGATAEMISLNIRASGDLAFIGSVNIAFETQYPNGEDCPGVCQQATENLVMEITQAGAP